MLSSHCVLLLLLLLWLWLAVAVAAAAGTATAPAVDGLRRRILAGLGLTAVPDITKMNVSREEYERMYGEYLRTVEENREARRAAAEPAWGALHLLTYTSSDGGDVQQERRWRHQRRRRVSGSEAWLQFELPERRTAVVTHASLHVLLRAAESPTASAQAVTVRAYLPASPLGRGRRLLDERRVHLAADAPKWADFDVTRAATAWLEAGERAARLRLECVGCASRNLTFGVLRDDAPAVHILAEVFPDGASARRKRNVVEYEKTNFRQVKCRKEKPRCCRHVMPVVFKDIGFEFIRQPLTFDLGYCKGRCPREFNPVNNHAFFQSILWSKVKHDNKYGVPRPCCAPKRLEPLEILHLDEHDPKKLKRVVWDDMRVIECACA